MNCKHCGAEIAQFVAMRDVSGKFESRWHHVETKSRACHGLLAEPVGDSAAPSQPDEFVDIPFSDAPCGHSSQYCYTSDGAKHIICLVCEIERLTLRPIGEAAPSQPDSLAHSSYVHNSGNLASVSNRVNLRKNSSLTEAAPSQPQPQYPLNVEGLGDLAEEWARDDRLWTTQETVAFNLKTFGRKVLSLKENSDAK